VSLHVLGGPVDLLMSRAVPVVALRLLSGAAARFATSNHLSGSQTRVRGTSTTDTPAGGNERSSCPEA
jgi:hypothetical protein